MPKEVVGSVMVLGGGIAGMQAAVDLFGECQNAGIAPERLIFDPVVAPLVWQDGNPAVLAG